MISVSVHIFQCVLFAPVTAKECKTFNQVSQHVSWKKGWANKIDDEVINVLYFSLIND